MPRIRTLKADTKVDIDFGGGLTLKDVLFKGSLKATDGRTYGHFLKEDQGKNGSTIQGLLSRRGATRVSTSNGSRLTFSVEETLLPKFGIENTVFSADAAGAK